jgi:hypothetical protein
MTQQQMKPEEMTNASDQGAVAKTAWAPSRLLALVCGLCGVLLYFAQAAFIPQQAEQPKRLLILPGGHYDLYGTGRAAAIAATLEWFAEYLGLKH